MDSIATITLLIIASHFCGGIQFQDDPVIERFRDYLKIDTAHPNPASKYCTVCYFIINFDCFFFTFLHIPICM